MSHLLRITPLCVALWATSAQAGNMGVVAGSKINKDELNVQWRNGYSVDDKKATQDNQWRQWFITDYGFTDDFSMAVFLDLVRYEHNDVAFASFFIEPRFELTEQAKDGYSSGLRLRYRAFDDALQPDTFDVRYSIGKRFDEWELRSFQIVGTQVGQDSTSGLTLDSRFQVNYHFDKDFRLGIESFSDFGNLRLLSGFDRQQHLVGPVVGYRITPEVSLDLAYHRGISDAAPDHSVRFSIVRSF